MRLTFKVSPTVLETQTNLVSDILYEHLCFFAIHIIFDGPVHGSDPR
jgi:hypothetical protein